MKFITRTNRFILASSTLIGTIVGVGLFGLPYVGVKVGVAPIIFYLLVIGALVVILHLLYGEIVLRTKEKHRLSGYAKKYLGRKGQVIAAFSFFFGLYGALLAYLVIGGQFLSIILNTLFIPVTPFIATLLLAVVGFLVVGKGIRSVGFFEVLMSAVLLSLILGLLVYGSNFISFENLTLWGSPAFLFLPYGVVLFALWGMSVIPELRDFFPENSKLLKRAIICGTVIPILISLIFIITVVGISGSATTPDAISGLVPKLGGLFTFYGALVGFLAVITSFVAISITMGDALKLDFCLPAKASLAIAFVIPLILFLLGARNFISIIDWVGAVFGSFEGVLILLIHRKAIKTGDREPEYTIKLKWTVRYLLVAVLLLAIVSRFF